MGAGILPVAMHNGKLFFLLGKENGNGGWSDFGGGREKNESLLDTAIREGVEELNGFIGTETDIRRLIKTNTIGVITTKEPVYKCYLLKIDYNDSLPSYFNSNFKLMNRKLKNKVKEHNGLFEKSEIRWLTLNDMKKIRMRKYFYHSIYPSIINFFSSNNV